MARRHSILHFEVQTPSRQAAQRGVGYHPPPPVGVSVSSRELYLSNTRTWMRTQLRSGELESVQKSPSPGV